AGCHGIGAKGTDRGPTFLSKIYEPNHHADASFRMAPQNGVRAHHWNFGDMPKIAVSPEELNEIIPYIRWLQRQAGVF
ncbi:MAG TPA: c-type cytochrome, partial [Candidatus Manganitrophaceae bacterium]|nr:c-type cytochrome [Candidatus Manganitrophaceae bacterium]